MFSLLFDYVFFILIVKVLVVSPVSILLFFYLDFLTSYWLHLGYCDTYHIFLYAVSLGSG